MSSKNLGEVIEGMVIDEIPELEAVDNGRERYDAIATDPIKPGGNIQILDQLSVPEGSRCEIKACQIRISNGYKEDRRGRWFLKQDQHELLIDEDGFYLLVVYAPDDLKIVQITAIPAASFDQFISTWSEVSSHHGGSISKVTWSNVFAPERVEVI